MPEFIYANTQEQTYSTEQLQKIKDSESKLEELNHNILQEQGNAKTDLETNQMSSYHGDLERLKTAQDQYNAYYNSLNDYKASIINPQSFDNPNAPAPTNPLAAGQAEILKQGQDKARAEINQERLDTQQAQNKELIEQNKINDIQQKKIELENQQLLIPNSTANKWKEIETNNYLRDLGYTEPQITQYNYIQKGIANGTILGYSNNNINNLSAEQLAKKSLLETGNFIPKTENAGEYLIDTNIKQISNIPLDIAIPKSYMQVKSIETPSYINEPYQTYSSSTLTNEQLNNFNKLDNNNIYSRTNLENLQNVKPTSTFPILGTAADLIAETSISLAKSVPKVGLYYADTVASMTNTVLGTKGLPSESLGLNKALNYDYNTLYLADPDIQNLYITTALGGAEILGASIAGFGGQAIRFGEKLVYGGLVGGQTINTAINPSERNLVGEGLLLLPLVLPKGLKETVPKEEESSFLFKKSDMPKEVSKVYTDKELFESFKDSKEIMNQPARISKEPIKTTPMTDTEFRIKESQRLSEEGIIGKNPNKRIVQDLYGNPIETKTLKELDLERKQNLLNEQQDFGVLGKEIKPRVAKDIYGNELDTRTLIEKDIDTKLEIINNKQDYGLLGEKTNKRVVQDIYGNDISKSIETNKIKGLTDEQFKEAYNKQSIENNLKNIANGKDFNMPKGIVNDLRFITEKDTPFIQRTALANLKEPIINEARPDVLKDFDNPKPFTFEQDLAPIRNQMNRFNSGADILKFEDNIFKIEETSKQPRPDVLSNFDKVVNNPYPNKPLTFDIDLSEFRNKANRLKSGADVLVFDEVDKIIKLKESSKLPRPDLLKDFDNNLFENKFTNKKPLSFDIDYFNERNQINRLKSGADVLIAEDGLIKLKSTENKVFYHGTTSKFTDEIFNNGLKPKEGFNEVYTAKTPEEVLGFANRRAINDINEKVTPKILKIELPPDIYEKLKINRANGKEGVDEVTFKEIPKEYIKEFDIDSLYKTKSKSNIIENINKDSVQLLEKPKSVSKNAFESLIEDSQKSLRKIEYERKMNKQANIPEGILSDALKSSKERTIQIKELKQENFGNYMKGFFEEEKVGNRNNNYNRPSLIEEALKSDSNKMFGDLEKLRIEEKNKIFEEPTINELDKVFKPQQYAVSEFEGKGTYERTNIYPLVITKTKQSYYQNFNETPFEKSILLNSLSENTIVNNINSNSLSNPSANIFNQPNALDQPEALDFAQPQLFDQPQIFKQPQQLRYDQPQALSQPQLFKYNQRFKQDNIYDFKDTTPFGIKFNDKEKKKKKITQVKSYSVYIKKRGKFIPIANDLTRSEALLRGQDITLRDLARTFKVRQTGTKEMSSFDEIINPNPTQFRNYKIRKGNKVYIQDEFIQLNKANLQNPIEKNLIKQAKRNRNMYFQTI